MFVILHVVAWEVMERKISQRQVWTAVLRVAIYIYIFKILRKASVRAETRTYGTDSPSRLKSRALSITPLHHPQKKTAQWRTSSALDSIHLGVIGRCYHVHLKHQIHGANLKNSLLFPEGQPILVETPNPRCQLDDFIQR